MTKDPETLNVYDQRATDYAAITEEDGNSKAIRTFQAALPEKATVLDFGCGPGHHSETLQANGFNVVAWDGSAEMVAHANKRGVNAKHADFSDLTEVGAYDGIWASFSLLHVRKSEFAQLLRACHRALKPGGQLYIGMKLGTGEERDSIGRFYAYYSHDELISLLADAGFTPYEHHTGSGKGLSGQIDPFIGIFARA